MSAVLFAALLPIGIDPLMRLETPRGPVFMPQVALGTWEYNAEQVQLAIPYGVSAGFTHIDTANNYRNQRAVGDAIRASTHRESVRPRPTAWSGWSASCAGIYASRGPPDRSD